MQVQALELATWRGYLRLTEIRPIIFTCRAVRRVIEAPYVWIRASLAHKDYIRHERQQIYREAHGIPDDEWVAWSSDSSTSND